MFNTDNFPDISFIDNSTMEDILTGMINDFSSKYEELEGEKAELAQSNPYRLIMYACASQIYQAMQYADHAGKMSFLTYATGSYLDNLAALRGIERKQATAAKTILQFSISEALESVVAIPAGTRATNGNEVYFATDEYAEIPVGETSVSVSATCTEAGTVGTGFAPGEFNTLVEPIAYVTEVVNTSDTEGGAGIESDDDLKDRIYSAPGGYSTTGPNDAYEYHTKNVSPDIGDVHITSETPGEVDVYFIMSDGSTPSASMISEVSDYLSDRTIRPLTDRVTVKAPTTSTYNIELTYYIAESDSSAVASIQADVDTAVSAYNIWQTEKIGRDINPSYLIKKIMEAGAKRVAVTSPAFTALNESTVAKTGTVVVNYGGVESD